MKRYSKERSRIGLREIPPLIMMLKTFNHDLINAFPEGMQVPLLWHKEEPNIIIPLNHLINSMNHTPEISKQIKSRKSISKQYSFAGTAPIKRD